MSVLIPRHALPWVAELSGAFRIVIVNGPRQSGKTTLLNLLQRQAGGLVRTLDDPTALDAARSDPIEFATWGPIPRIIDEVQRGGDQLVLAIKQLVDQHPEHGQFVLSGSARFLTIPTLSESLAGRTAIVDLWPLSLAERTGTTSATAAAIVEEPASLSHGTSPWTRTDYLEALCAGGYPEAVTMPREGLRAAWFDAYLQTVVQRDIRQFADIQRASAIERILRLVAARAGSPAVTADLSRTLELSQTTVRSYLGYLDTVFLTTTLPAWSTNLTTKAARQPKTFVADPGLAAHLVGGTAESLRMPGNSALGPLVETLAVSELVKLAALRPGIELRYFRDRDGREVDLILESRAGSVVAIEVKASASATRTDFRHLTWLRDKLGDRFIAGIVLYLGTDSASFGDRLLAAPLSALWGHRPLPR